VSISTWNVKALAVSFTVICTAGFGGKAVAMPSGTYAIRCDQCANPVIINMLRESYSNRDSWFVYDLQRQTIRYFVKESNVLHEHTWTPRERPVPSDVASYWALAMSFYKKNNHSLSFSIKLPVSTSKASGVTALSYPRATPATLSAALAASNGEITAWDAINEGYYRNKVVSYLNTQNTSSSGGIYARMVEATGMTAGNLNVLFGSSSPDSVRVSLRELGLSITVQFPDGSTQRYDWSPSDHSWFYVPGTSRDASGNTIPDNPSKVGGSNGSTKNYVFPGTPQGSLDAISWYQRVELWGVNTPSPQAPAVLACVNAGGTTSCTLSR
jgi:hypothetical protein